MTKKTAKKMPVKKKTTKKKTTKKKAVKKFKTPVSEKSEDAFLPPENDLPWEENDLNEIGFQELSTDPRNEIYDLVDKLGLSAKEAFIFGALMQKIMLSLSTTDMQAMKSIGEKFFDLINYKKISK